MSSDAAAAYGNITANAYTVYNLAESASVMIGILAVFVFFVVLIFLPKHMKRLLMGYCVLVVLGIGLLLLYALLMSLPVLVEVGVNSLFKPLGDFIIAYWPYILLSIPVAYLLGLKFEPYGDCLFGDDDGK